MQVFWKQICHKSCTNDGLRNLLFFVVNMNFHELAMKSKIRRSQFPKTIPEKFVIHLWSFVFKNKIHKRFVASFSKVIVFLPTFAPDKQNISLTKQLSNEQSALGATD